MRINRYLAALALIMFQFQAFAQQGAKINFEETTYDFGKIKEGDGPVEHKFVFTNTGNIPLKIESVRASCGCTTPAWSKEPILPGKQGFILAKYNPKNRPGQFHKSLTITSNADPATTRVYIKGNVEAKPKTLEDEFPAEMGSLRVKYKTFNMGRINTEKPVEKKFIVANGGSKALTFTGKNTIPSFIKVKVEPSTIEPKQKATITLTYDAKSKDDYGFVTDNIILGTNDGTDPEKKFRVVSTIEEYFPKLTEEEKANAPKLTFEKKTYDFGTINASEKKTHEFTFTNTGKSNLTIRKTKTNCGCTVSKLSKTTIKPGQTGTIKVTFDPTGRSGNQYKTITVYSNDPSSPTQVLNIKANIK
ncbi:DUF1573 domain-containing protein [Aureibacter tunicatorum]|uniref:HYDIN/VesB/CFA65-like Ig-like domain-containing protein n=1 Tax=Aureibacter tunicatorum TaxID=866807 RepID=A0AAE3XPY7_9BACT|nr:DUF1573 domain-containing protein [Aureibacter tunicatorum]MDR6239806.1 hypothetical protein [Aureibacter tunicatorum]BDD04281.1 hypothetical protein AUTU_17640 [Aureibacter tunicatorum]